MNQLRILTKKVTDFESLYISVNVVLGFNDLRMKACLSYTVDEQ